MNCTLRLYLGGYFYISKEIQLTADRDDLEYEQNFQIRESELKSAVEVFRVEYYRQIIKCQYNYDITATFKSQMKEHGPSYDSLK